MPAGGATVPESRRVGRYTLFGELAAGGMATVHVGRLHGTAGFKRTVAIKRLHAQFARDPEFVSAFLDEAQLVARIQHPNVVPVLDVVAEAGELFMVMEYVHGDALSSLLKAARAMGHLPSSAVAAQIVTGMLYGLHAAHEARSDLGEPLSIVHRDVSPQNVLVGIDGVARVLDFGVAKATQQFHETTKEGVVKGKVAYMAPEQLEAASAVDRRVDVYAAGVVLWEALTARRLHDGAELGAIVARILTEDAPPPSSLVRGLPPGLDAIIARAMARRREDRFATALLMAHEIEKVVAPIAAREVGAWVQSLARARMRERADLIASIEQVTPTPSADARASIHDIIEEGKRISQSDVGRASSSSLPRFAGADEVTETASGSRATAPEMPTSSQVMSDVPTRAASSRRWGLLAVMVGFVFLLTTVGFLSVWSRKGTPTAGAPASTSAVPLPVPTEATPPPSFEIVEIPAATAAPVPTPASSTAAAAPAPASSAPVSHPAAAPRPTAKKGCDPPWFVDARGVRVIKRECL